MSDNRFAAKTASKYVVVDFASVTEKGLKPLLDALKRAGQPVASVEASNRTSKRDGMLIKRAKLNFENGQSVTLFINATGDIFQMALNNKKHPVPDVDNLRALAKSLSQTLVRSQEKFDKSAAAKAEKIKPTATEKPVSRSNKQKLDEARSQLAGLDAQFDEISQKISAANTEYAALADEESALRAVLEAEKAETKQLIEQRSLMMEAK